MGELFEKLVVRLGSERVLLNPPLDAEAELSFCEQVSTLCPNGTIPEALLELYRRCNGQSGMPLFSYFRFMESTKSAERFGWFYGQHPNHLPFAEGDAEDYLMIDCSTSGTAGEISYWYIENPPRRRIATSLADLYGKTLNSVEALGEPNVDLFKHMAFAFDYPPIG